MPAPIDILIAISAAAFLFYGLACLFSAKLVAEFERYRLARWRVVVGGLEVAGAAGTHRRLVVSTSANGRGGRSLRPDDLRALGALADPRCVVCHASGLRPSRDESGDCFESELRRMPRG